MFLYSYGIDGSDILRFSAILGIGVLIDPRLNFSFHAPNVINDYLCLIGVTSIFRTSTLALAYSINIFR